MRILFDQGTPVPLRQALSGHTVRTAHEEGWSALGNGELLDLAEREFELLITTDQNLPFQQDLSHRKLGVLILPTTSWKEIQKHEAEVTGAVATVKPGQHRQLTW